MGTMGLAKDRIFFAIYLVMIAVIQLAKGQYPDATVEWDLMPVTGADNVDIMGGVTLQKANGSNILTGGIVDLRDPTITELGWMFEGTNLACSNDNEALLNFGDTFGFHTWIYLVELIDQTIWCKEWLETIGDPELNSLRLCLLIKNGQFQVLWNPSDALTHKRDFLQADSFNYQYQNLGVFAKFGWTYIAVNFKTSTINNKMSAWMYMANHDQCFTVSDTFVFDGPLVDDNKFALCVGGTAYTDPTTGALSLELPLKGLINYLYFVSGEVIERWHAKDAFGFQCHDYCQICRNIDQPKCLEDYETHVMHYWDFAPFRWYRPVFDYGNIPTPIGLGGLVNGNEVPLVGVALFTHHNGMWFGGGRSLVPGPVLWPYFSFTVDVWFKFYAAVGGTMLESIAPNPRQFDLTFTGPNTIEFTLNGLTYGDTFNFVPATDYNKWMILQCSVARVEFARSKICIKVNDDPITCGYVDTIYDPTINLNRLNNLQIGPGFDGFMRKMMIYDYPKTEPSMMMQYKMTPQCYKFHHSQTDCEYCDVYYNFTCYTDCAEPDQWDYDCKQCELGCYTCSGNDRFHCFSCFETRYVLHERCTCCPETCGDGFFMNDFEYDCDDGNNAVDDGCDSQCLFEADFTCVDGNTLGPTVCQEICGNGRKINHACDDGNGVNGDGCTNCVVDPGYQCTGGNRNTVDVCWEICGDGLNYGNYPCDDGNTAPADGCDASCTVELGWTCAGGSTTTPDVCTEICGDGYRTYHVCDDGNLVNGDGCDNTCAVELGWQCGHEAPSICWKITQPSIIEVTHEKGVISITFNETVVLDASYTDTAFGVAVTGPLTDYDVSYTLIDASILMTPSPNLTMYFSYTSSSQFIGNGSETLTLTFDQTMITNSIYGFEMLNSSISVELFPQESTKACGELVFQVPIFFIMVVILAVGVISTIGGHSMAIAWQALSIIQFVNFMPMMMIYSPSCLVEFASGFDVFNAKLFNILDWITKRKISRISFDNELNHKFIRQGYTSTSIFYNGFDILVIWGLVVLAIPILYGIRRVFFNKSYGFKLQLDKFRNATIYVLMLYSYMRLTLLVAINFRHANFGDTLAWVSFCTACVVSILVFGYPMYEVWNVKQFYKEIQTGQKPTYFRLYILYSDFKINHPLQYSFFWLYFLRRFLFVSMIIAWPQEEYATLLLSTIMHIGAMMYFAYVLPYTSRIRNIAILVAELGMVVIHGMLFPLMRGDPGTGLDYYHKKAFRFFFVVMVVLGALCVLIIFDSFAHVKKVLSACRKEPDDDGAKRILDSFSDDSMTQRDVSYEGSDDEKVKIELYDPKKEKEKIELAKKKKKKEEVLKGGKKGGKKRKPPTPPKKGEALVSEFGRPLFKETQEVNPSEGSSEGESSSGTNSEGTEEEKRPDNMFTPQPEKEDPLTLTGASMAARDMTPIQAKEPTPQGDGKLFSPRPGEKETPKQPGTPSAQNPDMTGANFQGGYKSAADMNLKK